MKGLARCFCADGFGLEHFHALDLDARGQVGALKKLTVDWREVARALCADEEIAARFHQPAFWRGVA